MNCAGMELLNKSHESPRKCASVLIKVLVFLCLVCIVLNPYTILGRPGIAISIVLAFYALVKKAYSATFLEFYPILLLMFLIGGWGALVSHVNGIGQFNHPLAVLSLVIITLSATGIWKLCQEGGIDFYEFLRICLYVLVFNSLVIILETNFLALRILIESLLIPAGNINWVDCFRYSCISSSCVAWISICTPIAFDCLFYLYERKKLGLVAVMLMSLILVIAVLNIGRTGLVMLPVVFVFYFLFYFDRFIRDPSWLIKLTFLLFGMSALVVYNFDSLVDYLNGKFGSGFVNYAFGFALQGAQGFESEGTLGIILSYLSVLPTDFPEVLIGYGFYGGSEFSPWTDSGYARTFLSVGLLLGIIFYLCLYLLYFRKIKSHKYLFYCILSILLLSEAKEPLLFSGNGSRIFILLLMFSYLSDRRAEKVSLKVT